MNTTTMMILMLGLVVVMLAIVQLILRQARSKQLRSHYGPEYEHLVRERGNQSRAEAELGRRERRMKRLEIRPLSRDVSSRYVQRWNEQLTRFVDEPRAAVAEADHLVEEVMRDRGYPVGEFDQRAADLSVEHPRVVEDYRAAHEVALREQRGQASTEDLRAAMLHYRDLFDELLGDTRPVGMASR